MHVASAPPPSHAQAGDFREWFDPHTRGPDGAGPGHPRRVSAQQLLNATRKSTLTATELFRVIDSPGVTAGDTIFQAIMSVERGEWNVSATMGHDLD